MTGTKDLMILKKAWFSLPGMIIRLDGGTKIILIHRVLNTALSIFHILLFFIAGTGTIFLLVNGNDFSYRLCSSNYLQSIEKGSPTEQLFLTPGHSGRMISNN